MRDVPPDYERSDLRALLSSSPPAMTARPDDESELADVLADASARELPVWPLGSGLHARVPSKVARPWMLLDMRGLSSEHGVDGRSMTISVGAGCTVRELRRALDAAGLTIDHLGPLPRDATVGGLLARSWPRATTFGYPDLRAACIGLDATYAATDGHYHYLPAPRKASGPDLRHLFLGNEGRCGVIRTAWLAAVARARMDVHLIWRSAEVGAVLDGLIARLRRGVRPWSVRLEASSDGAQLELRLAGEPRLVTAWTQALERVLGEAEETLDGRAAEHLAVLDAPPEIEAWGSWPVIRSAVAKMAEHDAEAVIVAGSPHGAVLQLDSPADTSLSAAIDALEWGAYERPDEARTAPDSALARRLDRALDTDGLWLARYLNAADEDT